jgi:tetratricopeptide (TPR) repeat protein
MMATCLVFAADQKYRLGESSESEGESEKTTVESDRQVADEMAEEFYRLGTQALEEGNFEKAEGYFDRVLILKPNHKGAKDGINRIMKSYDQSSEKKPVTENKPEPIKKKETAPRPRLQTPRAKPTEADRQKSDQLYIEALSANQTGNTEEAIRLCKESLALNPNNPQAKRMLDRLSAKNPPE